MLQTVVGVVVALVTGHPPDLDPAGDALELAGVLTWPGLWARYRDHLLGIDGSRPRSMATIANYRRICWDFVGFLGSKPWQRADPADLRRFLDRPAPHTRTGRRSANTANQIATAVKLLYHYAYLHGHTAKDRMAAFEVPKGGQPRPRSLDNDELRAVLLTAEGDPRLYVMVALGYFAGLRCAEIANLRVEDIDLRRRWLWVRGGKGGKDRDIPITPELAAALRRYLGDRPAAGPLIISERPPYGPLRPHTVTVYLSQHIKSLPDPNDPGKHAPTCPEKCKGKHLEGSGHWLRHSFATNALEDAGEEHLYTVSKLLGHSRTDTTETIYTLRFRGQPEQVVAALRDPRQPRPRGVGR